MTWLRIITVGLGLATGSALAYTPYMTPNGSMVRWWHSVMPYHWGQIGPSDFEDLKVRDILEASFKTWYELDCTTTQWPQGVIPKTTYMGRSTALRATSPVYVKDEPDNVIVFVPNADDWLVDNHRSWIAITKLAYDVSNGRMVDADIEINDGLFTFSVEETPVPGQVDFMSMLVHEIGHFYSLDHSDDPTATMSPTYDQRSSGIDPRSLEEDDRQGVCAVYTGVPSSKKESKGCQGGDWGSSAGLLGLAALSMRSRRTL